jgi:hypothetical protein
MTATKEYLISTPLPQHADTYTVISHKFVIDKTLSELLGRGFQVKNELYRCNRDAQIAQGIYHLNYGSDPEMGMMFAWSNSYDKSMRFKCAIGGYVFICMNGVVSGNMGSWGRKHTGSADEETEQAIRAQIDGADLYYNQLVHDKNIMKDIEVPVKKQAELLGRLYFEHSLLTNEQLSVVKHEMIHPSYEYNSGKNSLWTVYNHITHSLKKSHPRDWMDHQRMIHWFLTQEFNIKNSILGMDEQLDKPIENVTGDNKVRGRQLTLEEGIADAEKESRSQIEDSNT